MEKILPRVAGIIYPSPFRGVKKGGKGKKIKFGPTGRVGVSRPPMGPKEFVRKRKKRGEGKAIQNCNRPEKIPSIYSLLRGGTGETEG